MRVSSRAAGRIRGPVFEALRLRVRALSGFRQVAIRGLAEFAGMGTSPQRSKWASRQLAGSECDLSH